MTKNTKHTPAPWVKRKLFKGHTCISASTLIARVYSTIYQDEENEKANADLMSAAPELLEACQQIVWKLSHGTKENPNTVSRIDATVKMAVAAIKKARGSYDKEV